MKVIMLPDFLKFQNLVFYLKLIKFNNSKSKSWLKGLVFKWIKFKIQKLIQEVECFNGEKIGTKIGKCVL